jgi:hypothetical protein
MNLRSILMLRGGISVLFAAYLLAGASIVGLDLLPRTNGVVTMIDGLLAFVLWFALSKHPRGRWLSGLVLADGVVRVLTGLTSFIFPAIQTRVLGSILFFGMLIIAAIVLGAVGIVYVLMTRNKGAQGGPRGGALPALIVSACTLLFGLGVFLGLSDLGARHLLTIAVFGSVGLTYLITGLVMKRRPV